MSSIPHGGELDAAIKKYGGTKEKWLDLSTGINPNSYPVNILRKEIWSRLPDKNAQQKLLLAAAEMYGVLDGFSITVANGTQAILQVLPDVLDAKNVEIVSPTYGEHEYLWNKSGRKVKQISRLMDLSEEADTLVVVNPNNPDARSWQPVDLVLAAQNVDHLIVDEAFCDAYPEHSLAQTMPENAIILRSFGKFFGLAGLRLGFVIGTPRTIEKIEDRLGPWSVSGPALEIGAIALSDEEWISNTRTELDINSKSLARVLDKYNLVIEDRNALFVYVSHEKAKDIAEHLAKEHILVRKFRDMPEKLRFGLCETDDDLDRLEKVLSCFE